MKYAWKKKPFIGKLVEDVRRVWEHYLIYVNVILG